MDFKGIIFFCVSLILGSFNQILQSIGIIANIVYISYQIYIHYKKTKNGDY
jgi:hypothetical protein